MGILQKVKTKVATRYNAFGIHDHTQIPENTNLYCIDHIIDDGCVYALCIYNGSLRVLNPDDLFYIENENETSNSISQGSSEGRTCNS